MLSIVTVSFAAKEHLRACLSSVDGASPNGGEYEHIVVDNASQNGTVEFVEKEFAQTILLKNERNVGFAVAVNRGLRETRGDPILLLNPDCRLEPGAAEDMTSFLRSRPKVGAVSPMLVTPDGSPQISYARFPRLIPHLLGLSPLGWVLPSVLKDVGFSGVPPSLTECVPRPADAPAGSCLLVRRATYEDVGGMDERFFMYYEDIDWAYRMARAGWERYYLPSVQVVHDMGATWRSLPTGLQLARSYQGKYTYFGIRHGDLGEKLSWWTTVGCARLNVAIGRALIFLGVGGVSWARKTEFNVTLLKAHRDYLGN